MPVKVELTGLDVDLSAIDAEGELGHAGAEDLVAARPNGTNQRPGNEGGVAGGHPNCPNPDPNADCFEAHLGLGCNDEDCCNAVCDLDPFCCDGEWDAACVDHATALCEPDCSEFAHPGAIYSNFHPDCWDAGATHGPLVRADDLWWGENGGVVQEISFSIYNGTNNVSNLTATTLEIILSSTAPGHTDGTLDLSTAIAIIEVQLANLQLSPGFGSIVTIEPDGSIDLPMPGIYAGTRYLTAEFDEPGSLIDNLGQVIVNPVAVGASSRGAFREDFSNSATFANFPANFAWEIVADGNFGPSRILFDNAPQQQVISGTTGNPTNGGFSSGISATTGNMLWVTMPFELGAVPEGGDAWRVTSFNPHFFIPSDALGLVDTVNWVVWHRDGDNPPGDMIAQGSLSYPILEMSHPENWRPARIHPIPVDVVLEPGEYYLTVFGDGTGLGARVAWFTNAANGIKMVDANGPFYWRVTNYPGTWSKITTSFEPLPDQPDPDTLTAAMFYVIGEVADGDPTPSCPADLTGSGSVGVPDLLALLACWGPVAPGCEDADLTGSGSVGVPDLLALLAAWGPCPE